MPLHSLAGVRLEGHAVPGTVLCFFPGTVVRTSLVPRPPPMWPGYEVMVRT